MSFQVLPNALVVPAFQSADRWPRRRWSGRILLGFLILATFSLPAAQRPPSPPLPQAPSRVVPFETPQIIDPFELAKIREKAEENTELHRMRIALPESAFVVRPLSAGANRAVAGQNVQNVDGASDSLAVAITNFLIKLVCVILGVIVWVLIARKLAPDFADSVSKWWMPSQSWEPLVASADRLGVLMAEEKAVAEFQATLSTRAPLPDARLRRNPVRTSQRAQIFSPRRRR